MPAVPHTADFLVNDLTINYRTEYSEINLRHCAWNMPTFRSVNPKILSQGSAWYNCCSNSTRAFSSLNLFKQVKVFWADFLHATSNFPDVCSVWPNCFNSSFTGGRHERQRENSASVRNTVFWPRHSPHAIVCYSFIALSICCSKSAKKFAVWVCRVATVAMETMQLVLSKFKKILRSQLRIK